MRPTLLNFRSPYERTPEFNEVTITKSGDILNFKIKKQNRKATSFSMAQRFPLKGEIRDNSGNTQGTSFVGPGRYNDQQNFNNLVTQPCSVVMRKISAVPKTESGKPCYIMVGQSMQFEPAFLERIEQRREMDLLNITHSCSVSANASMQRRSMVNLRKSIIDQGLLNVEHSREEMQNSMHKITGDRTTSASKTPVSFHSNRKLQLCKTCKTPNPLGYSKRVLKPQDDQSLSLASTAIALDRSLNQFENHAASQVRLSEITERQKLKVKALLPKTATSYHQMRKGLLFTPPPSTVTKRKRLLSKNQEYTQSFKILTAYQDVVPILKSLQRDQITSSKERVSPTRQLMKSSQENMSSSKGLREHARNLKKLDFDEIDKYMKEMLKQLN